MFGSIALKGVDQYTNIFAIDGDGVVYKTTYDGSNWIQVNPGNEVTASKEIVSDNNGNLYILTGYSEIFKSTDGGETWEVVNSDYNGSESSSDWVTMACSKSNNFLFIIEKSGDDVWRSTDGGVTWMKVNDNYNGGVNPQPKGSAVDSNGNLFVVDGNADVWMSGSSGETWVKINDDYNGSRNNYAGDYIIGDNNHYIVMGIGGASYVYKSTDGGYTFVDMGKVTQYGAAGAMTFIQGSIYAAINYGNKAPDTHRSDDGAASWNFTGEIQTAYNIIDMTSNQDILLSDEFLFFDSSKWQIITEKTGYYTMEDHYIRLNTGNHGACYLIGKDGYMLSDQKLIMKMKIRSNFNYIYGNNFAIGFRNIYNLHENMIELNKLHAPLYGPNLDNYNQYRLVCRDDISWTTCGIITASFTDFLEIRFECSLSKIEVYIDNELKISCQNNITNKIIFPCFCASNADRYGEKSIDIDSIEIYYSN
jgi:photosystem II stability/assembly factor-like uncharacterized protein